MASSRTQQFIDALHHLEASGSADAISNLYADASETTNLASDKSFSGRDGARDFWTHYRSSFRDVESSFRNVIVDDDHAALEWETSGTGADGAPFRYDGVSIIEYGGDGGITRFRAFFDPAALGRQLMHGQAGQPATPKADAPTGTASASPARSTDGAPAEDGEIAPLTNADKVGTRSGTTGEAPTG